MMSQITSKHILDNQILLKLLKIFNSTEINPNSTYPLSQSLAWLPLQKEIITKLFKKYLTIRLWQEIYFSIFADSFRSKLQRTSINCRQQSWAADFVCKIVCHHGTLLVQWSSARLYPWRSHQKWILQLLFRSKYFRFRLAKSLFSNN